MAEETRPGSESVPEAALEPTIVLLVDDEPMVAAALRRQLEGERDLALEVLTDPAALLPSVREKQPGLVLLDLTLPGTDTLQLLRELRADEAGSDLPVILLASRDESFVRAEAFAAGATDFVVKLPDPVETRARIRYHAEARQARLDRDEALRQLGIVERELARQLETDELTGLANRRQLESHLRTEWRRMARDRTALSLLLIDIDYFSAFNESAGRKRGDQCILSIARALRSCARRGADLPARYGGGEFALVLPQTDAKGATAVAAAIRFRAEQARISHASSPLGPVVTVSVGAATVFPSAVVDPLTVLDRAASALEKAKRNGRNCVVLDEETPPLLRSDESA